MSSLIPQEFLDSTVLMQIDYLFLVICLQWKNWLNLGILQKQYFPRVC